MHKAAHCPNHNRLRMLSQPAIRLGLQAPGYEGLRYSQTF